MTYTPAAIRRFDRAENQYGYRLENVPDTCFLLRVICSGCLRPDSTATVFIKNKFVAWLLYRIVDTESEVGLASDYCQGYGGAIEGGD